MFFKYFSITLITLINLFFKIYSKKKNIKICWQHYFFGYLFIIYLFIALSEVVGFPSLYRLQKNLNSGQAVFNPGINLIPFSDGLEISAILNIIFFMPFGFLLPTLWRKYRRLFPTILQGFILSFIIEMSQLFTHRATDITDLIMNTIGALLGWLLFSLLSKFFFKLCEKTAIEFSIIKFINI
ncbi:VanZ family protein, partial [Clostridium tarantellae]|nr:VanZ family protein [Clostridium tarantellae]